MVASQIYVISSLSREKITGPEFVVVDELLSVTTGFTIVTGAGFTTFTGVGFACDAVLVEIIVHPTMNITAEAINTVFFIKVFIKDSVNS